MTSSRYPAAEVVTWTAGAVVAAGAHGHECARRLVVGIDLRSSESM
ncbi:MAG: hypothetical protein ABSC94_11580 [Polyangiaceae bacterium]